MELFTNLGLSDWGAQADGTYLNPVIWADYNNPFFMQHGDDFYMVSASHHFMGMPVLHSRDLVNWRIVARIYSALDFDEKYNHPGQGYQKGSWAPSLAYHNGKFIMHCGNSIDGLFASTAQDIKGPWEPVRLIHKAHHWEDPCPFWDDDGQAYLIHSGFGPSPLVIHKMSPDGMHILDEGFIIKETYPSVHNPMVIKRDGYYYIFGMGHGQHDIRGEYVYRSKNIYGPFEERRILTAGGEGCSPGGSGWAELPDGSCWFIHHVGFAGYGRIPFLEPAGWRNEWPWIGKADAENEPGTLVGRCALPFGQTPERSKVLNEIDDFTSESLNLAWRWNHNPQSAFWSLTERPGFLRLKAEILETAAGEDGIHQPVQAEADSILFAKNVLSQHIIGKSCRGTTFIDISKMADGQRAGFCYFNKSYAWIGVIQESGKRAIVVYDKSSGSLLKYAGPTAITQERIWLRGVANQGVGNLLYSLDGECFVSLGEAVPFRTEWFESHSMALFTYNTGTPNGHVDFDWFSVTS
jgi:beta-xylosidase